MFYLDASYQPAATTHSIIVMTTPSLYRFASVAVVIAIWILSFLPGSAMPQVPGGDKWHHALAYFACMFFWGQWLQVPAQRLKLAGVFILMGALIECLQGLTTYRSFEWLDLVADTLGVTMGWLLVTLQLAVQRRFARRPARADRPSR